MIQGLWNKKETQIETLPEAVERIVDPNALKLRMKANYNRRLSFDHSQVSNTEDSNKQMRQKRGGGLFSRFRKREEPYTQKDEIKHILSKNAKSKKLKIFRTKEEKQRMKNYDHTPGRDFYPWIVAIQFITLIYIIFFFTWMERDYSDVEVEVYTYDQFSAHTIMALLCQIVIIAIDRQFYLSKKVEKIKHQDSENKLADHVNDDFMEGLKTVLEQNKTRLFRKLNIDILLSCQKNAGSKNNETLEFLKQFNDLQNYAHSGLKFEETRNTVRKSNFSVNAKFMLQIFLMVLINFLIFWYLPARSHVTTGNHYY